MIQSIEGVFGLGMVAMAIDQARYQTPATPWPYRAGTAMMGVAALWLLLSVLLSFAPVTRDMTARVAMAGPGAILVEQQGVKARSCRWIRTDAFVTDGAGVLHEATLTWVNDRIPGNSRPVGRQDFGTARVEFDRQVLPVTVTMYSVHSCGWMWHDTTSRAGPWPAP